MFEFCALRVALFVGREWCLSFALCALRFAWGRERCPCSVLCVGAVVGTPWRSIQSVMGGGNCSKKEKRHTMYALNGLGLRFDGGKLDIFCRLCYNKKGLASSILVG